MGEPWWFIENAYRNILEATGDAEFANKVLETMVVLDYVKNILAKGDGCALLCTLNTLIIYLHKMGFNQVDFDIKNIYNLSDEKINELIQELRGLIINADAMLGKLHLISKWSRTPKKSMKNSFEAITNYIENSVMRIICKIKGYKDSVYKDGKYLCIDES